MKKLVSILLALVLTAMVALCFAETATGVYTVYNMTGEKLSELYLYPVGSEDKGENLASKFHGTSATLEYTAESDIHLVLEFVTESGYKASFDNLAIETAPITLLSADAMTGATAISFSVPEGTGSYVVYNMTGAKLSELYLYPVGSEDKGENLASNFHGTSATLEYTAPMDQHLVLEFANEDGYKASFDNLAIEVAPITLLSADAMTGATAISFTVPEDTGVYDVYNMTGSKLSEVYLYPVGSEDKGENLASNFHGTNTTLTYTAPLNVHLILEFATEDGYKASFDNLAIETAPITLLSADAMTGATAISFTIPEGTGAYNIYNLTGADLAELYLYPVGSEDKGENLADAFVDGAEINYTAPMNVHLVLEFTTKDGYTASFDNLAIETAPISLLSADAMTGATAISFTAPEK